MISWTGLAPWKFEFPFPGTLTSTFLERLRELDRASHLLAKKTMKPCQTLTIVILKRHFCHCFTVSVARKCENRSSRYRWKLQGQLYTPLPSAEGQSRPESGLDCLICAIFARQRQGGSYFGKQGIALHGPERERLEPAYCQSP